MCLLIEKYINTVPPKIYKEVSHKMAYIEIKKINGREYKYLRKSVRTEGKVKKISLKCLGPVDPIYRVRRKRKTNASIYVRQVKDNERRELEKARHSSNTFIRDRARILLLSGDRTDPIRIVNKVGCGIDKVRTAIKTFNIEGINSLQRKKAKGGEIKFTDIDKKIILIHFARPPREFGHHFTTWTLPRFRKHLTEKNVVNSISIETLRQILLRAGAKLTKSKRWQYSPDKNFLKRKE